MLPVPHSAQTSGVHDGFKYPANLRWSRRSARQEMLIGTFVVTASNSEALTTMVKVR